MQTQLWDYTVKVALGGQSHFTCSMQFLQLRLALVKLFLPLRPVHRISFEALFTMMALDIVRVTSSAKAADEATRIEE